MWRILRSARQWFAMLVLLVASVVSLDIDCAPSVLDVMKNCSLYDYKIASVRPSWCDYQPCTCRLGPPFESNETVPCEVRRKGSGSWRTVSGKPGLKIKFDEDQSVMGFPGWKTDKFTLNNFVQGKGESRGYEEFRRYVERVCGYTGPLVYLTVLCDRYGVVAPRTVLVKVRFGYPQNYVMVEQIGSDFTKYHFGEKLCRYEVDRGTIENKKPSKCSDISLDDFRDPLLWNQTYLHAYAAAEVSTNHWDGMCFHLNNGYVVVKDGLMYPVPWGLDQSMQCEKRSVDYYKEHICPLGGEFEMPIRRRCRRISSPKNLFTFPLATSWIGLFAL